MAEQTAVLGEVKYNIHKLKDEVGIIRRQLKSSRQSMTSLKTGHSKDIADVTSEIPILQSMSTDKYTEETQTDMQISSPSQETVDAISGDEEKCEGAPAPIEEEDNWTAVTARLASLWTPCTPHCGYTSTLQEANLVIRAYEDMTNTSYIQSRQDKNFGNIAMPSPNNDNSMPIKYKARETGNGEARITPDGIPYLKLGSRRLSCQFGTDKNIARKKRAATTDEDASKADHAFANRTKKKNCTATIVVSEVLKYPEHAIDKECSEWHMRAAIKRLRDMLAAGTNVVCQKRFYVFLPSKEEHDPFHDTSEAAKLFNPIAPEVRAKIRLLVNDGVVTVSEMSRHIKAYVANDLMITGFGDRRYNPSNKDLRNHIYRQRMTALKTVHTKDIADVTSEIPILQSMSTDKYTEETQKDMQTSYPSQETEGDLWKLSPIGHIKSMYKYKNGTPRQAGLCEAGTASLTISSACFTNPHHSLEGLQEFSHIWVIFLFHKNNNTYTKAKVRPPRLGGAKVGLFSTRCPYRPNAIGLSLVKLDAVQGSTVHISGVDLLDGTPVLDIKPYIPQYDVPTTQNETVTTVLSDLHSNDTAVEGTSCDSVVNTESQSTRLAGDLNVKDKFGTDQIKVTTAQWITQPRTAQKPKVLFTSRAREQIKLFSTDTQQPGYRLENLPDSVRLQEAIVAILESDPRSVYRKQHCSDRLYYFVVDAAHVTCWFDETYEETDGGQVAAGTVMCGTGTGASGSSQKETCGDVYVEVLKVQPMCQARPLHKDTTDTQIYVIN